MVRIIKKTYAILDTKQRKQAIVLILLMVLGAFLESFSVSLVLPLITVVMDPQAWNVSWYSKVICDLFSIHSQRAYIQVLLLLLIGIFILKNIYIIWEYYIQFTFISTGRFQMQKRLMESYIKKPYAFYLNVSSGEIIRIITVDTEQAFQLITNVFTFSTEGIVSIALGITVFIMSPRMAVGLLVVLLSEILLITKMVKPVMERLGMRKREAAASSNKWILQAINGIKSIKVSQTESFFNRMYSKNANIVVDADRKQQTLNNVPRLLIESITVTAVLGMVFIQFMCGTELIDIVPQLSALVVAAVRLFPCTNRISTSINQVFFLEGGLDNVIKVVNEYDSTNTDGQKEITKTTIDKNPDFSEETTLKKSLLMSAVSFSYPGNEKKILETANLEILPGQSVGIVGPSGAGKTTTVDILLGLLKPLKGAVIVDDQNIEEDLTGWLNRVAYIPQRIFLTDSTIRENVAFGVDLQEIDEKKVWAALREAQMEEFVMSLPARLDTMVGEQGIRLSGGQCQRIGIARALYRDPSVLFFDEATSSLDNETEAAIMKSIENLKGSRTLVIVAHRLTTIANCDVVYRVDNGKIIEESRKV